LYILNTALCTVYSLYYTGCPEIKLRHSAVTTTNRKWIKQWSSTSHGRNVFLRRHSGVHKWPWPLTNDLENHFSNAQSHDEYLWKK